MNPLEGFFLLIRVNITIGDNFMLSGIYSNNSLTKYTKEQVEKHLKQFNCELISDYKKANDELYYICSCGFTAKNSYSNILKQIKKKNNIYCIKCRFNNQKLDQKQVFQHIKSLGYKILSEKYLRSDIGLDLICPNGHKITKTWDTFKMKTGCQECCKLTPDEIEIIKKLSEESKKRLYNPCYIKWRNEVFLKNNFFCQKCYKQGGSLQSHHLNGYHWDKENRYNIDNGVCLCEKCHNNFHNKYARKYNTIIQYNEWNAANKIISNKLSELAINFTQQRLCIA